MIIASGINFPEIEDISMAKFIAIKDAKSDWDMLTLLIGDVAANLPEDIAPGIIKLMNDLIAQITAYVQNPIYIKPYLLATEVRVSDIKQLPYWPITRAKQIIQTMGNDPYNAYAQYCDLVGHYTYSLVTKKMYNEYEAEDYCKEIANTDFRIIIQLGDFFLFKHSNSFLTRSKRLMINLTLKKRKLASMFSTNTAN